MTSLPRRRWSATTIALVVGAALVLCHVAAAGATTIGPYTYTNPGSYSLTIPPNTDSISVIANGASVWVWKKRSRNFTAK